MALPHLGAGGDEAGVGGAGHSLEAGVEIHNVEALDVDLQRHRPHSRREIEQAVAARPYPLTQILRFFADDASAAILVGRKLANVTTVSLQSHQSSSFLPHVQQQPMLL